MTRYTKYLLGATIFLAPIVRAEEPAKTTAPKADTTASENAKADTQIGFRADCFHDFNRAPGATQECVDITGIRLSHTQTLSPKIKASLRIDPFGVPSEGYQDLPWQFDLPQNHDVSRLFPLDRYALIWSARASLDLMLESYTGATGILNMSGLSTANSFNDTGWVQTAVSAQYRLGLLEGMRVKFTVGNGEGQNGQHLDPQEYLGVHGEFGILPGVVGVFGVSQDGNNMGSAQHTYQYGKAGTTGTTSWTALGFSTQRLLFGAYIDGTMPQVRGLKAGVSFQRSTLSDLDKDGSSLATLAGTDQGVDPGTFLIEDPTAGAANVIKRQAYDVSFSYRILDMAFIGADFTTRQINSSDVAAFQGCKTITSHVCDPDGAAGNTLNQTAFSVGGGYDLAESLTLSFEYFKNYYDHLYNHFNFAGKDELNLDTWEAFSARLAYNWK